MPDAATFAAVFVALFVAHSVGDHWVQTQWQADTKGAPGRLGRVACARHVLGLTITKDAFYSLGTRAHPRHPVTAEGDPAATLGTGAYALDQSWHHLWLLVAALIIAAV